MLPEVDTKAIRKDFTLLRTTVGRDVELTEPEDGDYLYGSCPFCQEGRDRFKLFKNTHLFYCRRCERRGDVVQYVMEKQRLDFIGAVKWLGKVDTAAAPQPVHTAVTHHLDGAAWDDWRGRLEGLVIAAVKTLYDSEAAEPARQWLTARGVTRDTWGLAAIGLNLTWKTVIDGVKLPPGILLPRFSAADGMVTAVNCYLSKEAAEKYNQRRMYVKGSRPKMAFFNQLWLKEADTAVIVEGELDAALLGRFLPSYAVALASGGCETIPNLAGLEGKRVVLALDNDQAGQTAVNRWLEKLPEAKLAPALPAAKDVTELWQKGGGAFGAWVKELLGHG